MVGTSATWTRVRGGSAVLALLAVLVTTACGGQQAGGPTVTGSSSPSSSEVTPPATPSSTTPPAGPGVPADASLTVVLDDGSGTTSTWTLTCAPDGTVGGDHPDGAAACAALAALADPFAPVRKDMACTMVYGGPQTATVRGTWNGADVTATFDRTDGCRTARWDRVAPLLQPGTTAGRSAGAM